MTWKAPFDDPIRLANGKILRTLEDATHHIIAMPTRETQVRPWQVAVTCLLAAAEKRASSYGTHIHGERTR
jgi:hypothetical protein